MVLKSPNSKKFTPIGKLQTGRYVKTIKTVVEYRILVRKTTIPAFSQAENHTSLSSGFFQQVHKRPVGRKP
jgi:hypothetical protein